MICIGAALYIYIYMSRYTILFFFTLLYLILLYLLGDKYPLDGEMAMFKDDSWVKIFSKLSRKERCNMQYTKCIYAIYRRHTVPVYIHEKGWGQTGLPSRPLEIWLAVMTRNRSDHQTLNSIRWQVPNIEYSEFDMRVTLWWDWGQTMLGHASLS